MMAAKKKREEGSDVLTSFAAILKAQEPPLPSFHLQCAHFRGVVSGLRDHHLIEAMGMELLDDANDAQIDRCREQAYNALLLALCRDEDSDDTTRASLDNGRLSGAGAGFTAVPLHLPAEGVKRAHELVLEMVGISVHIRSESWAALLNAACSHSDDNTVESILRIAETSMKHQQSPSQPSSSALSPSSDSSAWCYSLAKARLRAYARAQKGYQCLEILQEIRRHAGNYEHLRGDRRTKSASERSTGTQARGRALYHQVIEALYRAVPRTDRHWQLIMAPDATADFILREMARDGLRASPSTIAALLTLYTKAAHASCRNGKTSQIATPSRPESDRSKAIRFIGEAELLLQKISAVGGYFGHPGCK